MCAAQMRPAAIFSASAASLPEETIAIRVTLPVLLAVISVVGGCLGGVLAYWAGRRTTLRRIVIGVITGFVLYWGFLLGVLPLLPHFAHAFVNDSRRLARHSGIYARHEKVWTVMQQRCLLLKLPWWNRHLPIHVKTPRRRDEVKGLRDLDGKIRRSSRPHLPSSPRIQMQ
jgi:hypothetical protein